MQADPAAHAHADRGDLGAVDENADLAGVTLADPADVPPPSVVEGARWVHDWLNMDAELAELHLRLDRRS